MNVPEVEELRRRSAIDRARCVEAVGVGLALCIIADERSIPSAAMIALAREHLRSTDEEWMIEVRRLVEALAQSLTSNQRDDARHALLAYLGLAPEVK